MLEDKKELWSVKYKNDVLYKQFLECKDEKAIAEFIKIFTTRDINERISKLYSPVSMGDAAVKPSNVMTEEELCLRFYFQAVDYDEELVNLFLADTKEANYYRSKITEMGIAYLALKAKKK